MSFKSIENNFAKNIALKLIKQYMIIYSHLKILIILLIHIIIQNKNNNLIKNIILAKYILQYYNYNSII